MRGVTAEGTRTAPATAVIASGTASVSENKCTPLIARGLHSRTLTAPEGLRGRAGGLLDRLGFVLRNERVECEVAGLARAARHDHRARARAELGALPGVADRDARVARVQPHRDRGRRKRREERYVNGAAPPDREQRDRQIRGLRHQRGHPVAGAHADMLRLSEMLRAGMRGIGGISVTLDSHRLVGIERPAFWMTGAGDAVAGFFARTMLPRLSAVRESIAVIDLKVMELAEASF